MHQWKNEEFRVSGFAQNYAAKAYFHQDHLGSTRKISGEDPTNAFRWDYTPMGEAYGFKHRYSHEQMTRTHVGHSPKRNLVPYLYQGKYETNLTGAIQMDARWYQPKLGRWLKPDYYNFAQLSLPTGARQQLLASTSLNTQGLLRDPAQQMRYGYVKGSASRWIDPLGLGFKAEPWDHAVYGASVNTQSQSSILETVENVASYYSPANDPFVQAVHSDEGQEAISEFTDNSVEVISDTGFISGASVATVGVFTGKSAAVYGGIYAMTTSATKTLTEKSILEHTVNHFSNDPTLVEAAGFVESMYGGGSGVLKAIDRTADIVSTERKLEGLPDSLEYMSNAESVWASMDEIKDGGFTSIYSNSQGELMCTNK